MGETLSLRRGVGQMEGSTGIRAKKHHGRSCISSTTFATMYKKYIRLHRDLNNAAVGGVAPVSFLSRQRSVYARAPSPPSGGHQVEAKPFSIFPVSQSYTSTGEALQLPAHENSYALVTLISTFLRIPASKMESVLPCPPLSESCSLLAATCPSKLLPSS